MRSAISPETPVSISSNTIVGSFTAPAIIALTDSMTRAISPPEATEEIFCKAPFLLAEKRKFTVSAPCAHYKVYKQDNETETNSHIRRLTDEERVGEIAHMLSGATLTDAALNNAKALLGIV